MSSINEDDRLELLNLMYRSEEEPVEDKPKTDALPDRGIMNMPAMSAEIRRLRADLKATQDEMTRMKREMVKMRRALNGKITEMAGMRVELDAKVDRKEY